MLPPSFGLDEIKTWSINPFSEAKYYTIVKDTIH